ncbi:hypothetical protein JOF36_005318 [Pseudonocardia parietis]|uniref:DDE Tnp4 domain-containing protein n=1 Tax=Pseudonocardia parietis TaxID=570936 RepID=A0ABS4W089_9PSEU|nr:hypothetical protein [Pseudonocardia parietis]
MRRHHPGPGRYGAVVVQPRCHRTGRARRPGLHGALLATRAAGHTHVHLDGTLIRTDRSRALGPNAGIDLWWSGEHHRHGANIQLLTASDGWPLWTSPVRPGREHDTTCARTHHGLLDTLDDWTDQTHVVLADLGYEGESTFEGPAGTFRQRTELSAAQRDILTKLGVDTPKKIIELGRPATP